MTRETRWKCSPVEAGLVPAIEEWLKRGGILRADVRLGVSALMVENARLRAVLGRFPRGLAVLDERGNVVGFNREFTGIVGCEPKLGEGLEGILDAADRELLTEVVRSAGGDRRSAGVLRLRCDEAREQGREVELYVVACTAADGEHVGVVLIEEERGSPDAAARELHDENARCGYALAANLVRRDVATALDDARRALAGARALAATETRSLLDGVEASLLLAASRLARWTSPPEPPPVRRANVATVARRTAKHVLRMSGLDRVAIQIALDELLWVAVAEAQLARILANLFSNAVRAVIESKGMGIVQLEADATPDNRVTLRVHDEGGGLDPSRIPAVFDPGQTAHRGAPGLGLGIARLLVEECGGSIRLISDPPRGTTVEFDLPRVFGSTS